MKTNHKFSGKLCSNQSGEKSSKEKVIKVGNEVVPVSEDIYKAYYKMDRRERYMENDVKVGRIAVNAEREIVAFIPSKEDSIDRLLEVGADFSDDTKIEDIICDRAMLKILQAAIAELNNEEQELIQDLYYKEKTVRQVAKQKSVSHVAIIKRHKKILDKLNKYFS